MDNTFDKMPFFGLNKKFREKFGQETSEKIYLLALSAVTLIYASFFLSVDIPTAAPAIDRALRLMRYLFAGLVLAKAVFLSDFSYKQFAVFIPLLALFMFTSYRGHDLSLFLSLIMIAGAKNVSYKKICLSAFLNACVVLVLVIGLCATKILPDNVIVRVGETEIISRHSLGFSHANILGLWLMLAVISLQQYLSRRIKPLHYILFALSAALSLFIANSRASIVVIIAVLILTPLVKKFGDKLIDKRFVKILLCAVIICCALLSLIMMLCYDESSALWQKLNSLLSGRAFYSHECYKAFGISLLGADTVLKYPTMGIVIDNVYVRIALTSGVFSLAAFVFLQLYSLLRAIKHKNAYLAVMCVMFCLYGLMEIFTYIFVFNITLAALYALIEEEKTTGENRG